MGDTSAGLSVVVTNVSSSPQTVVLGGGGAPPDSNFTGFQTCGGVTLAAGASCAFTYQFVPQTVGAHSTTTSFSINGQDSGTITLSGTGTPTFSITPTTIAFPATAVGDTSAGVECGGDESGVVAADVVLRGGWGSAGFELHGLSDVWWGDVGGGCVVRVHVSVRASDGWRALDDDELLDQRAGLGDDHVVGDGHGTFSITPTTIAFPDTAVGDTSAGIDVVVTNLASSPQLLSSVAGGAPPDANFTGFQTCGGVTLAAGASCAFTYAVRASDGGRALDHDELLDQRAGLGDDLVVGHGYGHVLDRADDARVPRDGGR